MKSRGIINAFQLKCIMAVFMLLDHIHHYIPGSPDWFTWLGRLVAPSFCFLMTDGMRFSSNRVRYIHRMTMAGLIMFAGNLFLSIMFRTVLSQNIFWSLTVSACLIYNLDKLVEEGTAARYLPIIALLVIVSIFCEGSVMIPVMALIFYYLRERPVLMCVSYAVSMAILVHLLFYRMFPQILMICSVAAIVLYDGRRGMNTLASRNFFYVFYPVHVWILFIIGNHLYK